jgi:predicted dehydrogenase/threonine dehydrogenase-like Zn-dependent dehydrogenase
MKQILQNLKTGDTKIDELPVPGTGSGHILIQTLNSLISAGTERMLMDFGKANWIDKARQQPDKVRMVLDKVKTDGLLPTIDAVRSKLDHPLPLGYCNVGTVVQAMGDGPGAIGFKAGDRIANNGPHAEFVSVPKNLCAKIPDSVSDEAASFTVLGAIALQGIRLVGPTLGECFVVTGLGLIGLLAVQLLKAQGCRVMGIDIDSQKCALADSFGAETVDLSKGEDPLLKAQEFSRGNGVDGVLITASTKSSEPVHQAAQMCRKRGRIVLVGVTGLELSRADFYDKELSFQVSCSYGPGRYDPSYEEKGNDYPIGFVRWTEQRNFEAVLDMMASGALNVLPLISHRFKFEDAENAYKLISENSEPYIGILLEYGNKDPHQKGADAKTIRIKETTTHRPATPVVGMIGAGNYSGRILLPLLSETGVRLKSISSGSGVSGTHYGKKFGFELSTTDTDALLYDPEINTVFITTRHNSHAGLVIKALKAGKHVFVEKPLCLTPKELSEIESVYASRLTPHASRILMVGFNRRFSPQVQKIKSLLQSVSEPKSFVMTVNAGAIPKEHWTQDPAVGGGRIIGEACHFIDLLRYLADTEITACHASFQGKNPLNDTATISLTFGNDAIGAIHYLANGHKSFPKERLEVFCAGRVIQLDNFRKLKSFGWPSFRKMNLWRQDKGQRDCIAAFLDAVKKGTPSPIPFEEIAEVTKVSFDIAGILDS